MTSSEEEEGKKYRNVRSGDFVQAGEMSGSSEPIIDLFDAEKYAKTDGASINVSGACYYYCIKDDEKGRTYSTVPRLVSWTTTHPIKLGIIYIYIYIYWAN